MTEQEESHPSTEIELEHINDRGHLEVGDNHRIYWEDWGNSAAPPTFLFHGGPGGSFNQSHKELFDPAIHRVIFHDQRGCGQSQPFAETAHNTTPDLIEDIEKLRRYFGLEQIQLSGGSWGSTMSLVYALAHPERVNRLLIWSVFLGRQFDSDFVNEGHSRQVVPEAWERFINLVPEKYRHSGDQIMHYYHQMINSPDPAIAARYADEWTLWEVTLAADDEMRKNLSAVIVGDPENVAIARLETQYFLNKCYLPENYILDNIRQIADKPCTIIHGRYDLCTPVSGAVELAEKYGPQATLQLVESGHLRTEPALQAAVQTAARTQLAG